MSAAPARQQRKPTKGSCARWRVKHKRCWITLRSSEGGAERKLSPRLLHRRAMRAARSRKHAALGDRLGIAEVVLRLHRRFAAWPGRRARHWAEKSTPGGCDMVTS